MKIAIRMYDASDWEAVCRVHDQSRPDELKGSFPKEAFVPLAEDADAEYLHRCQMFVAVAGAEVVGFAGVDPPYLAWLYVAPAFYRQGVGRLLLRHCMTFLDDNAWTYSCGNNTAALNLYQQEGFVVQKRFRGHNAGFNGDSARLALNPARRGWSLAKRSEVELRPILHSDLSVFFIHQQSAAAIQMAAFTSKDPTDHEAFSTKWNKILADESIGKRTILLRGRVVGSILSYVDPDLGGPEVTYWIGDEYWGQGIATHALRTFLEQFPTRPMLGRAAKDNHASVRVLQQCGFKITGEGRGFANARGKEIEELILTLQ